MLAWVGVAAAFEQVESTAKPIEDLWGRKDVSSGGRKLDRERQLIEAPAELGDRLVGFEAGAFAEELHRLRLGERLHRVADLPIYAQQLPARDKESQVRASLEQLRQLGGGLDHLLEVV